MLVAAPSGCCTGGMFSSGIHALGPFGAGEVTARVAPSTVALFRIVVDVHALQADGSAGSTDGINRGKSEYSEVGIRTTCQTFPALCMIFSRGLPPPRHCFAIFVPSFVKDGVRSARL